MYYHFIYFSIFINMSFLDENKENKLSEFVKFVKKELGIKNMPEVLVKATRDGLKTTANYDYRQENKVIKVYGKNRALVDVMRSIAHELVHHKQFEDGRLNGPKPPDIGGEIEDEANAKAGQYIKMFSRIDETIYDE
jgi:Zn-dependent peptidase ImmA (M78 family)